MLLASLGKHFLDRADAGKHAGSFDRHEDHLRVVTLSHVAQAFDVTRGDQVLRGIAVCLHGLRDLRDRLGFSFGLTQTCLRQTLGLQNT